VKLHLHQSLVLSSCCLLGMEKNIDLAGANALGKNQYEKTLPQPGLAPLASSRIAC
jgi:hypothetical protein